MANYEIIGGAEMQNEIIYGDCLQVLSQVPASSVDCVVCDLPYGHTRNPWDSTLPLAELWAQYNRICKQNAAVVLFGQGMFTCQLMYSNPKDWRYNLVWVKDRVSGFLNAKRMPLRCHEDICVFYRNLPVYNPQFFEGMPLHGMGTKYREGKLANSNYGKFKSHCNPSAARAGSTEKYPRSVLFFKRPHPPVHPTQKPVELYEWLIRTYTNEGALVLDNCCGSGTCAVACRRSNRQYLCIESESKYYELSKIRAAENIVAGSTSHNSRSLQYGLEI